MTRVYLRDLFRLDPVRSAKARGIQMERSLEPVRAEDLRKPDIERLSVVVALRESVLYASGKAVEFDHVHSRTSVFSRLYPMNMNSA